jgi:hypothetical protein
MTDVQGRGETGIGACRGDKDAERANARVSKDHIDGDELERPAHMERQHEHAVCDGDSVSDANGNRINKYSSGGWYAVYVRNGEQWELHGEPFRTPHEADAAAARIRRTVRA